MDYREKVKEAYKDVGEPFLGGRLCTLADLNKVIDPKPKHGDRWGNWKFDARMMTLDYAPSDKHWDYYVRLKPLFSQSAVLDVIMHLDEKNEHCVSREDIGNLVAALNDLRRNGILQWKKY